jgi:hypothetical protein
VRKILGYCFASAEVVWETPMAGSPRDGLTGIESFPGLSIDEKHQDCLTASKIGP